MSLFYRGTPEPTFCLIHPKTLVWGPEPESGRAGTPVRITDVSSEGKCRKQALEVKSKVWETVPSGQDFVLYGNSELELAETLEASLLVRPQEGHNRGLGKSKWLTSVSWCSPLGKTHGVGFSCKAFIFVGHMASQLETI